MAIFKLPPGFPPPPEEPDEWPRRAVGPLALGPPEQVRLTGPLDNWFPAVLSGSSPPYSWTAADGTGRTGTANAYELSMTSTSWEGQVVRLRRTPDGWYWFDYPRWGVACPHRLTIHFGPFGDGDLLGGTAGIAWTLNHVTGSGSVAVASGTTSPSGYILYGYTPTGPDESYTLTYTSPLGGPYTVDISVTVIPPDTSDCYRSVWFCPAQLGISGCCQVQVGTLCTSPLAVITVDGGPLLAPFDLPAGCGGSPYLPEGGPYSASVVDPDHPPSSGPKTFSVGCTGVRPAPGNGALFNLDFIDPTNADVTEHLAATLTLTDGTGNDVTLTRPAPAGIPGRTKRWWGCKVFPDIKTATYTRTVGYDRCDVYYPVAVADCTVGPYGGAPVLETTGADVAVGYLFDGCTLTLYALRCEYDQFAPPECLLKSGYTCADLEAAVGGTPPAPTPPAPPDGFTEVSTLAILDGALTECYPDYSWTHTMGPPPWCLPSDALIFDPAAGRFYQFHTVDGCPVDVDWQLPFYPAGATFTIEP